MNVLNIMGKGNNTVNINGVSYSGKDIVINENGVMIDGVQQSQTLGCTIEVKVEGDCDSVQTASGDVECKVAGKVQTASGDVHVSGHVNGNIQTASGDVNTDEVAGSVKTMSGDITTH